VSSPSCVITPSASTNCVGGSTSFTVQLTSGTAPYTVVLSGCISETVVVTTQNGSVTRSHSCASPGTCTLTANVTDANGCVSAPCTAIHTCVPNPTCDIRPAAATNCVGGSTSFTVQLNGGKVGCA